MIIKTYLVLIGLFSFQVFAEPPKLTGSYGTTGGYDVLEVKHEVILNTSTQAGNIRYYDLRNLYYTCQNIMASRVKCSKMLDPNQTNGHESSIEQQGNFSIYFSDTENGWNQTVDSESEQSWEINQVSEVIFPNSHKFYSKVKYFEIEGLNKLNVGDAWLNQVDEDVWAYTPKPFKINQGSDTFTYRVEYLVMKKPDPEEVKK